MRKTYEKACQVTFVVTHKQDMLQGACGRIQERGTARAGNTEILTPLQKEALTHILHAHTPHEHTHTSTQATHTHSNTSPHRHSHPHVTHRHNWRHREHAQPHRHQALWAKGAVPAGGRSAGQEACPVPCCPHTKSASRPGTTARRFLEKFLSNPRPPRRYRGISW